MMVAAFLMGSWLGVRMASETVATVLPLTNGLWFWSVLIAGVAWTLVQRYGEAKTPPQPVASVKQA
jgi:DHA1 family bicyclomycin/chloramphenicol resistance-like MFS transporter